MVLLIVISFTFIILLFLMCPHHVKYHINMYIFLNILLKFLISLKFVMMLNFLFLILEMHYFLFSFSLINLVRFCI